jgi:hypothetical protein
MDGSEVKVYTDDEHIHQEFAHGQNDNMWMVHEILSTKLMDEKHLDILEEEDIVYSGVSPVMGVVVGIAEPASF